MASKVKGWAGRVEGQFTVACAIDVVGTAAYSSLEAMTDTMYPR